MQKHPRNTRFDWQARKAPFELLTEAQAAQYDRDGWFILPGAFSTEELSAMTAAIDPLEQRASEVLAQQLAAGERPLTISRPDEITFTTHLVLRSPTLRRFSRHPTLTSLAKDLLGAAVRLYWDQAVYKKPGNPEEFPWHQDNGYTYIEPQQYLTCWIPLVDATLENGCPWVVPGLHRTGTLAHRLSALGLQCFENHPEAVAAPVAAGDVLVFSSLTPHRTGPNLSDEVRKAYILQYAPDGVVGWPFGYDGETGVLQNHPDRQYLL